MRSPLLHLLVLTYFLTSVSADGHNQNEAEVIKFLQLYDREMEKALNNMTLITWKSEINLDEDYGRELVSMDKRIARLKRSMRQRALAFNASAMNWYFQRQLSKIKDIGVAAQLNQRKYSKLAKVMERMNALYLADLPRGDFTMMIYGSSKSHRIGWRMRKLFTEYVKYGNEAVKLAGYKDLGKQLRSTYKLHNLEKVVKELYKEVLPFYVQLHAYVRMKLIDSKHWSYFPNSPHIPETVIGFPSNNWNTIYHSVKPFKKTNELSYKNKLISQNYTVLKMFETAEDFLTSLGFEKLPLTFWEKSVFVRPSGRHMDCDASASDFFDGRDFRVKVCGGDEKSESLFPTAHRLMGYVAYFMAYKDQPTIYKDAANDAFYEAIGGMIEQSFETPEHLKKRNLIETIPEGYETDIKLLMKTALKTVAFIPYTYLVETWRWNVFNGKITKDTYMRQWNRLRCNLTGISPNYWTEKEFLPGSNRNIGTNVSYLRYFFGYFLQFQFLKAACAAANHTGPLHRCDIYNSTAAGHKLREMMTLGSSKPWPEVLKQLTGESKIDHKPLLEYFKPLRAFLSKKIGGPQEWGRKCP